MMSFLEEEMGSYPYSFQCFQGLVPTPERPLSGCVMSEGMHECVRGGLARLHRLDRKGMGSAH